MQLHRRSRRILSAALALGLLAGCASFGGSSDPSPAEGTDVREDPAPSTADEPSPSTADEPGLLELCRLQPSQENAIDETRRILQETFCGATLWFDGLFGGGGDVANARSTSGRVEVSALHSEFHGFQPDARLRLRYDLPTLERRINVFLGRTDRDRFIADREEGFALRSTTLDQATEESWLAGLGYAPPGRWSQDIDFRVGGRIRLTPEVFVQGRLRRNVRVTDRSLWRLRQTLFWESDDGVGSTSNIEYDRVLTANLLFHWSNIGTVSQASEGLEWRSAGLLYHYLGSRRAVAGELFARGATSAEVPLQEWGTRAIYRQSVFRPFLFAELVVGYSWPRYEADARRNGSPMIGLGTELVFGRNPP